MHYSRLRNNGTLDFVGKIRVPLIDRFSKKYTIDTVTGCWNWDGAKCKKGYGIINLGGDGPARKAHRISYELRFGPIPKGEGFHGTCVCHRCDNSSCVNPDHLFLGTVQDNNKDMLAKGRNKGGGAFGPHKTENMLRGAQHKMAVFTEQQIIKIRALYASGVRQIDISKLMKISPQVVNRVVLRKAWTHI